MATTIIDHGVSVRKIKGILRTLSHAALVSMAEKEIAEKVCDDLRQKKNYNTKADRKQLSKARVLTGRELLTLRKAREELDSRPKKRKGQKKKNTTPITLPGTPLPEAQPPIPLTHAQNPSRDTETVSPSPTMASRNNYPPSTSARALPDGLWNPHQNTRNRRHRRSSSTISTPTIFRTHMPDRPLHMKLRSR
ncbi:hypothetical protein HOY82DRAFT_651232 [Tuber indicum]|nr:hypothetical protein HOY82DRAFT_651232 [Tuber indicum]